MNRNDEVPRLRPPWAPNYFIMNEIKQKTGRKRNEARRITKPCQSMSCELSKASRQDDIETHESTPIQTLADSPVAPAGPSVTRMGASQKEKRRQRKGGFAK